MLMAGSEGEVAMGLLYVLCACVYVCTLCMCAVCFRENTQVNMIRCVFWGKCGKGQVTGGKAALCLHRVSGIRDQVSFILISQHQAQREASVEECCKNNEQSMLNKE